jgi:hypothetical protein
MDVISSVADPEAHHFGRAGVITRCGYGSDSFGGFGSELSAHNMYILLVDF